MADKIRKIILSRKGFDSTCGYIPSPIIGEDLISMPIPEENISGDTSRLLSYEDLIHKGTDYRRILRDLAPKRDYRYCHMDPDLSCANQKTPIDGWRPAFGQVDAAKGILNNNGVTTGDIILFFGWFRRAERCEDGQYRFIPRNVGAFYDHSDLHVIYGYMEIGEVIIKREDIEKYYWHPHSMPYYLDNRTNTLYRPADTLSILDGYAGYGLLPFNEKRVLTKENRCRSIWGDPRLGNDLITKRKNAEGNDLVRYRGRWQELIYEGSDGMLAFARTVISGKEQPPTR